MSDTTALQEFAGALARFQEKLPHVGKDQKANTGTYSYEYADLSSIQSVTLPLLAAEGFSFSAKPTLSENGFVLRYALRHEAGHEDGGDYPLPDPARSTPQQIGSAITYGRRYAFCAVTGVAPSGEDDDGQSATDSRAQARESFESAKPASRSSDAATVDLQKQIRLVGELAGMDPAGIKEDFIAHSGGVLITAATPDLLRAYLAELQSRSAVA